MSNNVRKLTTAAMLCAMTLVCTMVIQIPTPTKGYFNLGEAIVLLSGFVLGPLTGGIAAGIGAMLADVLSSYTVYAPATLAIKFLTAAVAGMIFQKSGRKITAAVIGAIIGEIIMIGGYFLFECLIVGGGMGAVAAAAGIFMNTVQAVVGAVIAILLLAMFKKTRIMETYFNFDK